MGYGAPYGYGSGFGYGPSVGSSPAAPAERYIAFWPLDEASGNRLEARGGPATLVVTGSIGSTTLGNGKTAANFVGTNSNYLAVRQNGLDLNGGGSYSICCFGRTSTPADSDWWFGQGGGVSASDTGPSFLLNSSTPRFQHRQQDGTTVNVDAASTLASNTDVFLCCTYDEAEQEITLRLCLDGETILKTTASVVGVAYEQLPASDFRLGARGTAAGTCALAQFVVSREVMSDADFLWFCNGMDGRTNEEIIAKIGDYPSLASSGLKVREHTDPLIESRDVPTDGTYFMRPYPLHEWDETLAGELGRYLWAASSDHADATMVDGIIIGFSDDPGIAPTTWRLIWEGPQVLDGGRTYSQPETPNVVYCPTDANSRPFYLYLHESTGKAGYTVPQETRLLTSADLISWTNEGVVMPVDTDATVNNHKGYASVFRDGESDWLAIHLMRDSANSQYGYSTSADGKSWTAATWLTNYKVPLPSRAGCEPGKALEFGGFTRVQIGGVWYALLKYHNSLYSNANADNRAVVLVELDGDMLPTANLPTLVKSAIGAYPGSGYLQGVQGYDEDGILHIYEKYGYPKDNNNEDRVVWSTAIIDSSAAATARPVGVSATTSGGTVTIAWANALPHQNYRVYRSATRGGSYTLLATVSGTSYEDTTSDHWYYVVRSYSGETESEDSAIVMGGKYDQDAIDYFDRVERLGATFDQTGISGTYTAAHVKQAYSDLIEDLKTGSLWSEILELNTYVGCDFDGLNQKLKYTKYPWRTLTAFASGDYVAAGAGCGLKGNGSTKWIATGFNDAEFASGDDRSAGVWCTEGPTTSGMVLMGSGNVDSWNILRASANINARWPQDDASINLGASGAGFWSVSRRAVNDAEGYKDGVSVATDTSTAAGTGTTRQWATFANFTTIPSAYSDDRRILDVFANGLSDAEMASLYSAFDTFAAAFGV